MRLSSQKASEMVQSALDAVSSSPATFHEVLDQLPAPIYATDAQGTITYFNSACVELAGRTPKLGRDKWCVTWKIFTTEGEFLPHDECPMAVAIHQKKAVRNVEAIAERPDGTRVNFVPFPTPYFDDGGNLAGAVNLLLDVTAERRPAYLRDQAERCRRLAGQITDAAAVETLVLMAAKYEEQALKLSAKRA